MSRAAQLRSAENVITVDAADWLCDVSHSQYVELIDKWFDKNPEIAQRFFNEAVVPAAERAA